MCGLNILMPTKGHTASKTVACVDGKWTRISDYDLGYEFTILENDEIENIEELAECVKLVAEYDAVIVRGALTAHARATIAKHDMDVKLNRRMDKLTGDNPSLMECNRSWLMLDIDGWLIPEKYDLYNIEDHPFIIEEVIHAYLCDAFHDVKCFYQFSAQCGTVAGRNNLKVHLWFWISKPHSNVDIRSIFKVLMPSVDRKVFTGNQPHFVANPEIVGGYDPLPTRFGWHKGMEDEVVLPPVPQAQKYVGPVGNSAGVNTTNGNWLEERLLRMGDGADLDGFYDTIRGIIWDYSYRVQRGGVVRNDQALINLIISAVKIAPKAELRNLNQVNDIYQNEPWIQREIDKALNKRVNLETLFEESQRLLLESVTARKQKIASKNLPDTKH